jgi:hypothetical protein
MALWRSIKEARIRAVWYGTVKKLVMLLTALLVASAFFRVVDPD